MEILLIRHGECFQSDIKHFSEKKSTMNPPLTVKGIAQAHKLAERLRNCQFDRIYCSDLDRAIQTAEILNANVNSNITMTEQFREIDMGDIYKTSWDNFPDIYSKWILHQDDIPYPNGENGDDVWKRCSRKIEEIISAKYERVAIVCHGGTIRSIICGVLNIPQQKRFNFGFPPENCSISVLLYKENNFYLQTFNDFSHINSL